MLNETHILASGDGKDLLETVFFVVIAVISIFGSLIGKFLKKNDENEEAPSVDESIFGKWEEEEEENPETNTLPPPIVVDYGNTSAYDEQLRELRRQTLLAQEREKITKQTRLEGPGVHAVIRKIRKTAHGPAKNVPAPKSQTPPPAVPARTSAQPSDGNADDDIFDDREALRRAVLAQEILSPPLSLR
ncbi:MAG: hypothetical protein J6L64_07695 [Opitutales bacterium]|nr:hypothetical protein [Opitutales bacterium]